jgi:hypothetical protein
MYCTTTIIILLLSCTTWKPTNELIIFVEERVNERIGGRRKRECRRDTKMDSTMMQN